MGGEIYERLVIVSGFAKNIGISINMWGWGAIGQISFVTASKGAGELAGQILLFPFIYIIFPKAIYLHRIYLSILPICATYFLLVNDSLKGPGQGCTAIAERSGYR